jgi:hypothetical protein
VKGKKKKKALLLLFSSLSFPRKREAHPLHHATSHGNSIPKMGATIFGLGDSPS